MRRGSGRKSYYLCCHPLHFPSHQDRKTCCKKRVYLQRGIGFCSLLVFCRHDISYASTGIASNCVMTAIVYQKKGKIQCRQKCSNFTSLCVVLSVNTIWNTYSSLQMCYSSTVSQTLSFWVFHMHSLTLMLLEEHGIDLWSLKFHH